MSKFLEKVKALGWGLVQSIRLFPLEAALGLVYFLLIVLADQGVLSNLATLQPFRILTWFFPHYVLLFTLHQLGAVHGGKARPVCLALAFAVWLLWIPLLFMETPWEGASLAIAWLLGAILLVLGYRPLENEAFGRNFLHTVLGLVIGLVLGGLLVGIVEAIVGSIDALFSLALDENWYIYPIFFVLSVVMPLLCCYFVTGTPLSIGANSADRSALQVLIDYILSPALVIYAVILYMYLVRILVLWELPEGGVAYMVLGFLTVGLLCHLLRLQVPKRHFEWFYKAFPAIAAAPLVLLWAGVFRRIGDYGLTEERVYLLVLCALVTLFVAMMPKERTRKFQLMAVMLGASAILVTYFPGIRAADWGIRSQEARLQKRLPGILQEGKFPVVFDYASLDSLQAQELKEAYGAWVYLKNNMRADAFESRYGSYGSFNYEHSRWMTRDNEYGKTPGTLDFQPVTPVDLGAYTQFVPGHLYERDFCDKEKIVFYDDSGVLLECPVQERVRNRKSDADTDVLIYKNERYMAVFYLLRVDAESFLYDYGTAALFRKP